MGLGVQTLANTAMLTVQQPSVLTALEAGGYSSTFTAAMDPYSPLVTFEVTGGTQQQAVATTDEIIRRFTASVTDLQVGVYGVAAQDQATAKRIDIGNNIQESNANVLRAAVAVAGVGLMFTLAFSLGVDALIARRQRRRASGSPGVSVEDLSPRPAGPAPAAAAAPLAVTPASLPAAQPLEIERVAALPQLASVAEARIDEARAGASASPGPDATVVLPLAYRSTRRRPEDRAAGPR
jgi:hypothetical protein